MKSDTTLTVIKISLPVNQETCDILHSFYIQRRELGEAFTKDEIKIYEFDNIIDKLYKETLSKLESCITKDIQH